MSTKAGQGGCGCGSAGTSSGGGCGCAEGSACTIDAYVRPQFFAGQLLTEEDLELLVEYVTAKNRLHNRSFLGPGVVCGLQVACHPCGGGDLIVRPGHALDCCGNDVVVPCQEELDLNAMIHALRVEKLGGYDCGDPCDQPAPQSLVSSVPRRDAIAVGGETNKDAEGEVDVRPVARRYALYVSYCETPTDPVAPYATGEPCGAEGCQPTRVREGYRFELRCPAQPREPDDLLARVKRCAEELRNAQPETSDTMWQLLGTIFPNALQAAESLPKKFTEDDAAALIRSAATLEAFAASPESMTTFAAKPEAEAIRGRLDELRTLVMTSARLNALSDEDREAALETHEGLADAAERAPKTARAAAAVLAGHVDKAFEDDVARATADALLDEGPRFTEAETVGSALPDDIGVAMAMAGAPVNAKLMAASKSSVAQLKEWLLTRLDEATLLTDCALRRDVERIDVSESENGGDPVTLTGLAATSTAASDVAAALVRFVSGCICAALLPPCSDCDDTAVLLATIEVQECNVTRICNLERTIPLTGTALGYWLPVQHLMRVLEEDCCEARPAGGKQIRVQDSDDEVLTSRLFAAAPQRTAPAMSLLRTAGFAPDQAERLSRAMRDVSTLSVRDLFGSAARAPSAAPAAIVAARDDAVTAPAAATGPEPLSEDEVAELASKAAADAVERAAGGRLDRLEERLKDLSAMKREITTLRKRSDELKQRNSELEESNRALATRLDGLAGGS